MAPIAIAAVLISGALATAGVMAVAEGPSDRTSAFVASGANATGFDARDSDDEVDRVDDDRDHEFSLDVSGDGLRRRVGVRINEGAPSVAVDAGDAGHAFFSMRRVQRDDDDEDSDDEDSDSERRRGRLGRRDDEDSERRNRRVGTRDRDRDNPFPTRRDTGVAGIAFDHGFNDGYDRGLEDGRDRNRYDPVTHRDYRSADRGYEGRYGSREQYRIAYRDGFRDGYERGYRDGEDFGSSRTGRIRWPWPF